MNLWLNGNQKWFFYGIAVKNLLSTIIFKSVFVLIWFTYITFVRLWKIQSIFIEIDLNHTLCSS